MTSVAASEGKNGRIDTIFVDNRPGDIVDNRHGYRKIVGGGPAPFASTVYRGDLAKLFMIDYDKDPSAPDAKVTDCYANDWDPNEDTAITDITWDDSKSVQYGSSLNAFVGVYDDGRQQLMADFDEDGYCYPIQTKQLSEVGELVTTFSDMNGKYDVTYDVPDECQDAKVGKNATSTPWHQLRLIV